MPYRETFWNIPHWAEIGQYLLGALTILIFVYGVIRHVRRWRAGQPEERGGSIGRRLASLWREAIWQNRTRKDGMAGWMHLTIFWGFAALFVGTALATIDWDMTHLFFDFQFLTDGVYLIYELTLDVMSVSLLVGLGIAIYRRYILKPSRLKGVEKRNLKWDDAYALGMLAFIALSGFGIEGLRLAASNPDWAVWSPVGYSIGRLFSSLGDESLRTLHLVLWVGHTLIAFGFIASIPYTKFFHMLALPLNIYYRSFNSPGELAPMRQHSDPGVREWRHFTWKQLLDFDACIRCGRCQDVCPAYLSGADLSPRDLMIKLRAHFWEPSNGKTLIGDVIKQTELWACTTCNACVEACPAFINHPTTMIDVRRNLVFRGEVDELLQETLINLGRYGNSFGKSERMRARWSQPIQPKIKDARREAVEYLWFLGDYASYHPSVQASTLKLAEIFRNANLDFGILYEGERNSGNDVRRIGEEGLYEMLMEKNLQALARCDYQAIVTSDPHTYNTLRNEYKLNSNGNGGHLHILHYTELLDQMISSGKLTLNGKKNGSVTYHDPCYLGRYNGIYDAPRRVIQATGKQLIEMPAHAENALCCGAGGGRIWMEEVETHERPSEIRVREAAALPGVDTMIVSCPKDMVMFQDAVKTTGIEKEFYIKDVVDLVFEAL